MGDPSPLRFLRLDFVYSPCTDVAAERTYFVEVLGGRCLFAIDGMGTRVAALEMTEGPPLVLLADHVEGDRPILVYRVADLEATLADLERRGWAPQATFEIPHGPICSFQTPGGHRIAAYELTRPDVEAHFIGRFDF